MRSPGNGRVGGLGGRPASGSAGVRIRQLRPSAPHPGPGARTGRARRGARMVPRLRAGVRRRGVLLGPQSDGAAGKRRVGGRLDGLIRPVQPRTGAHRRRRAVLAGQRARAAHVRRGIAQRRRLLLGLRPERPDRRLHPHARLPRPAAVRQPGVQHRAAVAGAAGQRAGRVRRRSVDDPVSPGERGWRAGLRRGHRWTGVLLGRQLPLRAGPLPLSRFAAGPPRPPAGTRAGGARGGNARLCTHGRRARVLLGREQRRSAGLAVHRQRRAGRRPPGLPRHGGCVRPHGGVRRRPMLPGRALLSRRRPGGPGPPLAGPRGRDGPRLRAGGRRDDPLLGCERA